METFPFFALALVLALHRNAVHITDVVVHMTDPPKICQFT